MQPEPPEFYVGEKATFKHIERKAEKTTFTRQVGTVTCIQWNAPFYEFTLQGDHVDNGRWYKQTELDQFKEGNELASHAAEAAVLSNKRSALEIARTESEHLRGQNEALSMTFEGQAADLAIARALISDLEESEATAKSAKEAVDGSLLQAYQDLEAARVELDACKEQIATLSTAAEAHESLKAKLTTALAQVAELERSREQVATLSKATEAHEAVRVELESARGRIAELEKEAAGRAAMNTNLDSIMVQLQGVTVASGPDAAAAT